MLKKKPVKADMLHAESDDDVELDGDVDLDV